MQEKNKEYNEKEQQIAENRSRNTLFERRENLQKHESYASERRQYDAIRNGQTDRIQSVFQLTPDGTPGILSRNELRNSKNMFIAGITLFTRAAIEGGVPEETALCIKRRLYSDSRRVHQQIFHRKVITKSSPEICPGSAEVRNATLQQRN